MLPTRWKIFRVINYLHIFCACGIVAAIGYVTLGDYSSPDQEEYLVLLCFILGGSLLTTNSLLCLHFVEKCYPDKEPGKRFKTAASIVVILTIIFLSLVTVACIILTADVLFNSSGNIENKSIYFWMVICWFVVISGFYICRLQLVIDKLIHHNHQLKLNSFFEEPTH